MILGIPNYTIKIYTDLSYEAYFYGSHVIITSLSRNSIKKCKMWSALEEAIHYLRAKEMNHKFKVLIEQISITGIAKHHGNCSLYSSETIVRSFEYYACSRTLYRRLIQDYQLPGISVLQRITSTCRQLDNEKFIQSVFTKIDSRQNKCIILLDEIYIKPSLTYHGGQVFGKATDQPNKLAKTILSVMLKSVGEDKRFNDPLRAEIRSIDDSRFLFLKDIGQMTEQMKPSGKERIKCLTRDASKFISHICYGFIELAKQLLTHQDYVLFCLYTTDPLEKAFGKLRQGTGGTYYITVQNALEKISINKAKLCLQVGAEFNEIYEGHKCDLCVNEVMTEKDAKLLENLQDLERKISIDVMASLLYISGYIQRKCGYFSHQDIRTYNYYNKYGAFLDSLNRGKWFCLMIR